MFRIRFRLISLFAVMSLVAIATGVFGMHYRAGLAEEHALNKVASKGGWVIYGSGCYVEFFAGPADPILDCGTGVDRIYQPRGSAKNFTDADLALFEDVRVPCRVNLTYTSVTPAAADQFQRRHPKKFSFEYDQSSFLTRH